MEIECVRHDVWCGTCIPIHLNFLMKISLNYFAITLRFSIVHCELQRNRSNASIKSTSKWLLWFASANTLSIRMCITSYSDPAFAKNLTKHSRFRFRCNRIYLNVALEPSALHTAHSFLETMKSYRQNEFVQSMCIINLLCRVASMCTVLAFASFRCLRLRSIVHVCYLIPSNAMLFR